MIDLEYGTERDTIDELIEALNLETGGEPTFERDVLDVSRPEDWGAVEMVGAPRGEYADGHLIDQCADLDIWICVSDRAARWRKRIQQVLDTFQASHEMEYSLPERGYLHNLHKVMWRWRVTLWDLELPEAEEEDTDPEVTDPEGTDPEDTDPEETDPEEA